MSVLFSRQIVFEGVVGKSYQGDIAIDDLKLIKSPCPYPGDYVVFVLTSVSRFITFPLIWSVKHSTVLLYRRRDCTLRSLVSHSFVFVHMQEFGYYTLLGASRNEGNHC